MTKSTVPKKRLQRFSVDLAIDRIPDVAIAILVTIVFQEGFAAFISTFIFIELACLAVWLRNSGWHWTKFHLREKEGLAEKFARIFQEEDFPQPREYCRHGERYLSRIVTDESAPVQTRLRAARLLGEFDYLVENLRAQEYLRLTYGVEEALLRHTGESTASGQRANSPV